MDLGGDQIAALKHLIDNDQLRNVKQIGIKFRGVDQKPEGLLHRLQTSGFVRFFTRENKRTNSGHDMAWFNANYSQN